MQSLLIWFRTFDVMQTLGQKCHTYFPINIKNWKFHEPTDLRTTRFTYQNWKTRFLICIKFILSFLFFFGPKRWKYQIHIIGAEKRIRVQKSNCPVRNVVELLNLVHLTFLYIFFLSFLLQLVDTIPLFLSSLLPRVQRPITKQENLTKVEK